MKHSGKKINFTKERESMLNRFFEKIYIFKISYKANFASGAL